MKIASWKKEKYDGEVFLFGYYSPTFVGHWTARELMGCRASGLYIV